MEKLKKIEYLLLVMLWIGSLTTYSIAILNGYSLFTSNYFGLLGLTIATSVAWFKPEKALGSVLILLFLGLFNLLSFVYYFNMVMTFGVSFLVTPGIQLISLVLLIVLLLLKREEVATLYGATFGASAEEQEQANRNSQNRFKKKFEALTDVEIENKLAEGLVPEAVKALKELLEERKAEVTLPKSD